MNLSKTKKKVALIKAACYALELHPNLKGNENLKRALELATKTTEHLNPESLEISRSLCENALNEVELAVSAISSGKVRKALERQIEKIKKY